MFEFKKCCIKEETGTLNVELTYLEYSDGTQKEKGDKDPSPFKPWEQVW